MNIIKAIFLLTVILCSSALLFKKAKHASPQLPTRIIAGEIHYSRIPVEYWEHRLQTVKAMGFNALSVYIMWNYHEVKKGVFDYQT